jgi:hypothetical protein
LQKEENKIIDFIGENLADISQMHDYLHLSVKLMCLLFNMNCGDYKLTDLNVFEKVRVWIMCNRDCRRQYSAAILQSVMLEKLPQELLSCEMESNKSCLSEEALKECFRSA